MMLIILTTFLRHVSCLAAIITADFNQNKKMLLTTHSFHIPVMGLAFTIDSPVKVARFGISSVVSITEDRLVEMMRKHYYTIIGEKPRPIPSRDPDHRAKRITDYLNLLNKIVNDQIEKIKVSAFKTGSDIVKYFEMLPADSKLRQLYNRMVETIDEAEKESLRIFLRSQIKPGSIDVNIMTKLDKPSYDAEGNEIPDNSDALSALRGFAFSNLVNSSVVLSAGMNPRLFNYIEKLTEFDPVGWGQFRKKITIKVSDYRSALIQGKMLAKKGIWVSEYRIESGLNCGGHAFATDGYLLGPILQEFKDKRESLANELHAIYVAAAEQKGKTVFDRPHPIRITVQGGIGTSDEDRLMRSYYQADATGWGTPFLLCPEATTVDDHTLQLLRQANKDSVTLSNNSPLGVRFHYLKGTTSDLEKDRRIKNGRPGSPCTEKHLVNNTEFTKEPICTASKKYQSLKIEQLKSVELPPAEYEKKMQDVLAKECLCVGLSNSASLVYNVPFVNKLNSVTICPGPNIVNFSKIVSLRQMVDHIYGRTNVMTNPERPHMFINELILYVDYLRELVSDNVSDAKQQAYIRKFAKGLTDGILYYRSIIDQIKGHKFAQQLDEAENEINTLVSSVNELSQAELVR
jgi:hypothetical protein